MEALITMDSEKYKTCSIEDLVDHDAENLRRSGLLFEEDLTKCNLINTNVVGLIKANLAQRLSVLPMYIMDDEKTLKVATNILCSSKHEALLKEKTNYNIDFCYVLSQNLHDAIAYFYQNDSTVTYKNLTEKDSEDKHGSSDIFNANDGEEAPIIDLFTSFIKEGINKRATDIHFEPKDSGMIVKYRLDGDLEKAQIGIRETQKSQVINVIKIMAKIDTTETRDTQDGRFTMQIEDEIVEFRVGVLPTIRGENITIRALNQKRVIPLLDKLGFKKDDVDLINEAITDPCGLIILCGPTSSGKSTTINAAMKKLFKYYGGKKKFISLEDPVEYRDEDFVQCQVTSNTEGKQVSFEKGLKAILRSDPNVIQVGEIRDNPTAETAIRAASTGHLVFSTVHAINAVGATTRIIDLGGDLLQTIDNISCIISQRLVKKNCPNCAQEYTPNLSRLSEHDKKLLEGGIFKQSTGCPKCKWKKTDGVAIVYEILLFDENIREFLSEPRKKREIKTFVKTDVPTFTDMWTYGLQLVKEGIVSLENLLVEVKPER